MNIHINKEEFNSLMSGKLAQFTIGSKLYGLDDEHSDTDYLIITHPWWNLVYSPFASHHQFQYKDVENNIDYNIVDISTFVQNLCTGDSVVNYELLYSKEFEAHGAVNWLCKYKEHFRTYNIIKAYIGFSLRDIKYFNKRIGRDKLSGMLHIERSYVFAQSIVNGYFTLKSDYLKTLKLKSSDLLEVFIITLPELKATIKNYRQNILNPMYERKEIPRFLDPKIQAEISNQILYGLVDGHKFQLTKRSLLEKIFYANENPEFKYN